MPGKNKMNMPQASVLCKRKTGTWVPVPECFFLNQFMEALRLRLIAPRAIGARHGATTQIDTELIADTGD